MTLHHLLIDLYGMLVIGVLCILAPILVNIYKYHKAEKKLRKIIDEFRHRT